jgi:hypothetical protein
MIRITISSATPSQNIGGSWPTPHD